ncbi:MAG: sugar ABC transporter ATP-binding protein [Pirellulaceae bacterium]|nr:sugar ABC transporter ATP-binding protein [Pirellulaceae bacterium]
MSEPMLQMSGISKRFGATQALQSVSLEVKAGEALALIGENGAGKSTLMKVLSGAHRPDSGSMLLNGQPFQPQRPVDARRAGVAMIYQELNLAPDLSVEDNIMLGIEASRLGCVRRSQQREKVRSALAVLGHDDLPPERRVGSLSIGAQQVVEIARGLVSEARVMIFDEPTSSLSRHDVGRLFAILERLKQQGMAIIYISHFLEEVRQVAKNYVVLRDGQTAGAGSLDKRSDDELVSMMIGRSVDNLFPKVPHQLGPTVLKVENLTGQKAPLDTSFELRRGEILGLFGLIGAGRTETLRCLLGLDNSLQGHVTVGNARPAARPNARMQAGLGLVSEDRKSEGLAQPLSIADNLTLSALGRYSRGGLLRLGERRRAVSDWMTRLSVKARDPEQQINQLSGGNQQKVAIARVLHQAAEILLLDEPTRGIDVGTKAEIYRLMGALASQGKSIIFVSSYLPELLAVCDSVGVMSRGKLREIRAADDWTENEVLSVAIAANTEVEEVDQ